MKKKSGKKVSASEMDLLSMLWEHGSLSLAEAHKTLGRPIGYTTVQTRLNRLVKKGLATRSKERPARYKAAVSPETVSTNHLEILLDRVTKGNIVPLVAHLVDDRSLTREEVGELKKIIQEVERRLMAEEDKS